MIKIMNSFQFFYQIKNVIICDIFKIILIIEFKSENFQFSSFLFGRPFLKIILDFFSICSLYFEEVDIFLKSILNNCSIIFKFS